MSRIHLQPLDPGEHLNREAIVGWHDPLQTYFAQVIDGQDNYGEDIIVLDLGNYIGEIATPEHAIDTVRPYAVISEDLHEQLLQDRRNNPATIGSLHDNPGEPALHMDRNAEPSSYDVGEVDPTSTLTSDAETPSFEITDSSRNYVATLSNGNADDGVAETFSSMRRAVAWLRDEVEYREPSNDTSMDVTIAATSSESVVPQPVITLNSARTVDIGTELGLLAELMNTCPEPTGLAWLDETRLGLLIDEYVLATVADHDPKCGQRRIETRIHRDNIHDEILDYMDYNGTATDNPTEAIDAMAHYLNFDDDLPTTNQPPDTWLDELPRYWRDELTRTQVRGHIARFDDPDSNRRIEIRAETGDARWHAVSVEPATTAGPAGLTRHDLGQYQSADELVENLELRLDRQPIQIPADTKAELAQFEDRASRLEQLVEASERLRDTLRTGTHRQAQGAPTIMSNRLTEPEFDEIAAAIHYSYEAGTYPPDISDHTREFLGPDGGLLSLLAELKAERQRNAGQAPNSSQTLSQTTVLDTKGADLHRTEAPPSQPTTFGMPERSTTDDRTSTDNTGNENSPGQARADKRAGRTRRSTTAARTQTRRPHL